MNLGRALKGSNIKASGEAVVWGGQIRVRGVPLSLYLEARVDLVSNPTPRLFNSSAGVRLVDLSTGANVGMIVLRPYAIDLLSGEELGRALEEVVQSLETNNLMPSAIVLAHRMAELGYGPESVAIGRYFNEEGYYVGYFEWVSEFTYRGAVTIDVGTFTYRLDQAPPLLMEAILTVQAPCCGGSGRDLYAIAADALRPWSPAVELRTKPRLIIDLRWGEVSDRGFRAYIVRAPCAQGSQCGGFTLYDYFEEYIPALARRIKEYVDARGAQLPSASPA